MALINLISPDIQPEPTARHVTCGVCRVYVILLSALSAACFHGAAFQLWRETVGLAGAVVKSVCSCDKGLPVIQLLPELAYYSVARELPEPCALKTRSSQTTHVRNGAAREKASC